ncbi:MAG: tRNA (adenosine(37)-N6)-threonylcarbamoyltransferase complex dimerization subunit type 1 TsaB [Chloroflexota bacterium]|nr:tRNA (adenosine(37)-N6)-threonylcarbamoyltransferase complex dimerization subunit type 1 TsaB [Chloroflexota bacterium]MDE2941502.1 tRNA (adenosine(37)-N6)-threonylcarbamoyltransferase complex dimerization subunit type 1 TsaB [Chloroflexota bacterium]MDE3267723.1 tRNA (adenosine(37)-N6)-threonylcarbamoyltransferase complex dimerization subunit type 1 TsaB [Chloroflexota bacterium]
MELAIDTSTRYAGVCLSQDGRVLVSRSWYSRQNHTVELLPAVDELLKEAGVTARDLECVFVAIGPGGFSALRVGLSTAKGLCTGLNIPLVALNTLDVEAEPYHDQDLPVYALLDMGRGEAAAALYEQRDGDWQKVTAERIAAPDDICAAVQQPVLFCGEGVATFGEALTGRLGDLAVLADQSPPTRSPATLASMGSERHRRGDHDDVRTVEPLYLRRPSISTPRRPA